jgi:hypothetical protein
MGERHTNESGLEVTRVTFRALSDLCQPGEWIRFVSTKQPEMACRPRGVCIEWESGARPPPTQLPEEQSDRGGSPTRQFVEHGDEVRRLGKTSPDPGDVATVAIGHHARERLEARRCPKVVTAVTAGVEQCDEDIPVEGAHIDDPPDPGSGKLLRGPFGCPGGDWVSEQRGGHEPSLDLGVASIDVDAELGRIAPAEPAHSDYGES